jgi:hypothetical protein
MKNFTCNSMKQRHWQQIALAAFVPSYPTSIRGNDATIEGAYPGTR